MKSLHRGALGACLLASVVGLAHAALAAIEEKPKAPSVFVMKAKPEELFDQLSYPVRVVAKLNSTLLAETDGVVSAVPLGLGRRVSKGERILSITHTDPVYQYAPAAVTSPIAGVVSSLDVTEGTQVTRGQRLGTVTDPARIHLTSEIPAQDLPFIRKGAEGSLRVSSSAEPIRVRVTGVSPFVDPATGTAPCEIALLPTKGARPLLAPGEVGQVSFKARARQGVSLPDHAITYKGTDPFVRVLEGTKSKRVAVVLGTKQRGYVEILKGLAPGAVIVERSSRFVADGEEVSVQNPEVLK